ncbi:MAG: Holliday junction branch migration protein RuvA [Candidatus Rifleibacteriota bacterium]
MIESITGKLISKLPHKVILEQSGICYEIQVPFSTSKQLSPIGDNVKVLCHLQWREDGPQLFGFATEEERQLFRILNKVNKVGPKLAINIMSASSPSSLASMILSENTAGLNSLKGVGPKLASRLIVELKEPISKLGLGSVEQGSIENNISKTAIPFEAEVRDALENLGYTGKEITQSLKKVSKTIGSDPTIEEIIEAVLRSFSG